jgi:hypothetical protein
MVESSSQNAVYMLDESKVILVEGIFLGLVTVVQSNLFAVVYDTRMLEAKFAFKSCFVSNIFAEGWRESAHDRSGELNKQTHGKETFTAHTSRK